jgi:ribosomal protein S18 acetylase RimI-like enzyme
MSKYRVVHVDCASATVDALKSAPGRKVAKLLEAYAAQLRTCFPETVGTTTAGDVRDAIDAALGVKNRSKTELVEDVLGLLRFYGNVFLVLERGRVVAGCTTRRRIERSAPRADEIDNVCVSEGHRGRGVCGTLVSAVAKAYADANDKVVIVCESANEAACRCYSNIFRKSAPRGPHTRFAGVKEGALPATAPSRLLC